MPFLLRKPPPTTKGQTNMKIVMDTLPNVGETVNFTAMGWILSKKYSDKVSLLMMNTHFKTAFKNSHEPTAPL